METISLDQGVHFHYLPTRKFKTTTMALLLRTPLTEENATSNALLKFILRAGCEKYPSYSDISRAAEMMYGASFEIEIVKKGEEHLFQCLIEILSSQYAGEDLTAPAMALLKQVLYHPLLDNNKAFRQDIFAREKGKLAKVIQGKINDKKKYALDRCVETMCSSEPFSIPGDGTTAFLNSLTPQSLYVYYQNVLLNSPMEFALAGEEKESTLKALQAHFPLSQKRRPLPPAPVIIPTAPKEKEIREEEGLSQSRFVIGLRCGVTVPGPEYYALLICNELFGGGASSRLFTNVREKESLCYYIHSFIYRFKSIMMIQAGIEEKEYKKCRKLILKELDKIQKGKIEEEEILQAKKSLINHFEIIKDSPHAALDYYLTSFLAHDTTTLPEVKEQISRVTTAQVIEKAQKLTVDTVYLLA